MLLQIRWAFIFSDGEFEWEGSAEDHNAALPLAISAMKDKHGADKKILRAETRFSSLGLGPTPWSVEELQYKLTGVWPK